MLLFNSTALVVQYDEQHHWLSVQWYGHHDDASVRAGCARLLALVRQTGSTRLLNDSSEVFGEWYAAAEWIGSEFLTQLHEAGVRAIAWINAMDWPTRNCVASSLQRTDLSLATMFEFDQKEEAAAWLTAS